MNKRKVTKRKGSKIKAKNDTNEVFVLPPNLLEALGINLGSIQTAPECSSGSQVSERDFVSIENSAAESMLSNQLENDIAISSEKELVIQNVEKELICEDIKQGYIFENSVIPSSENETSIIQTANLMTASVFLSPTFVSNNRSIIEGEIEIVGNIELEDEVMSKPDVCSQNNEHDCVVRSNCTIESDHGISCSIKHRADFSSSNLENVSDAQSSEVIEEINHGVQSTGIHFEIHNDAKDIILDDHADEAYSSDGSNGNVEMSDKSSNCSVLLPINNSKKISIISEQILDPSQFKAFQTICSPRNNCLIPVTIDTVLKSCDKNTNCYQSRINSTYAQEIASYYIAPRETTDSHSIDVNEQNSICEYTTVSNQVLEDSTDTDQNSVACNSYFMHSIMPQVNEDIVMHIEMQEEDTSQHVFDVNTNEFDTHSIIPAKIKHENEENILDVNTCDTSTNSSTTTYGVLKENEPLQVDIKTFDTENIPGDSNMVSGVSEDAAIIIQMQECASQRAFDIHIGNSDNQLIFDETFNRDENNDTMKTNIPDEKDTSQIIKTGTVKVHKSLQNGKVLGEQNVCGSCNMLSSIDENVIISPKTQEDFTRHETEEYKNEFDMNLILPDKAPQLQDNCIRKSVFSDTVQPKSNIVQKTSKKLQKEESNALRTRSSRDKLNSTLKDKDEKTTHSQDSKRKTNNRTVKDNTINRSRKYYISRNLNKKQNKSNGISETLKIEKKQIRVKKVLNPIRNKNGNRNPNETFVHIKVKSIQQPPEISECNAEMNKDVVINCNCHNKSHNAIDESAHLCSQLCNNDDQGDNIREIAGYLSKFAELQKRKKKLREKERIRSIKTYTSKKHTTNTKLSIQGVEKPGGSDNVKNMKTYERKRKSIQSVKMSLNTSNYDSIIQKINLLDNSSETTCNDNDLCLCDDFGRLEYDNESVYENINFSYRKLVDCTPDLIFSIYNENIPVEANNDSKKMQNFLNKICPTTDDTFWNETNSAGSQILDEENEQYGINRYESIETALLNKVKPSDYTVEEQTLHNASKWHEIQAINNENLSKKSIVNINQLENRQEGINNNFADVNPMKNEKKRKHSSIFNGSDKSLAAPQHVSDSHQPDRVESGRTKKQKIYQNGPPGQVQHILGGLSANNDIVCGVCRQSINDTEWLKHIASQHNYISWKVHENPLDLDNRQSLIQHLSALMRQYGELSCNKCGTTRKYAKSFLQHINQCAPVQELQSESILNSTPELSTRNNPVFHNHSPIGHESEPVRLVVCGVCRDTVLEKNWHTHIESQHDYLAWKLGNQTLDIENEEEVKEHLYNITKECGGLKCAKCGLIRKYVKSYLTHIKSCDGQSVNESLVERTPNSSLHIVSEAEPVRCVSDSVNNILVDTETELVTDDLVKCGVCGEFMHRLDWNSHNGSQHNYLAWKHGEPVLDIDDEVAVKEHLYNIVKEYGELKCAKCGLSRKYVKSYQTHVRNCTGGNESINGCEINDSLDTSVIEPAEHDNVCIGGINHENRVDVPINYVQCAVCGESMEPNDWYEHAGIKHHYLAWICGDPPLDINDEEATQKHLQSVVKQYGSLKCVKCGLNRKYVKSYLTHVKSCTGPKAKDDSLVADDSTVSIVVLSEVEEQAGLTKCGVCGQYMPLADWAAHMEGKHNYLAWKDDEPPLNVNDKEELSEHLNKVLARIGNLICTKCGEQRRSAKSYLRHIEKCDRSEEAADSSKPMEEMIWPAESVDKVKCGVCCELVPANLWLKHIAEQHNYLATKDGETSLDLNDDEQVYKHLYNIAKENGVLVCQKCGLERKYVKSYQEHIRKCGQDTSVDDITFEANTTARTSLDTSGSLVDFYSGGTCGVCDKEIESGKWIQHTQKEHNYLAWRKGEKPWDLDEYTDVNEYLYEITKKMGGLTCNKCGMVRKYVKTYLTHIKSCDVVDFNLSTIIPEGVGPVSDTAYRCAMCQQEIERSKWKSHAMREHYNITWIVGETPIDIKNPYAVEKYLKEYKQYHSLKCNNCGATRASFAGFYAHIITCGKTEEQIEMFQSVCEICNNKYLCIYKNQHMMIHRVQEYNKELKIAKANVTIKEETVKSKKRQAAEKARSVIETYSSDMSQHKHKCGTCGFGTDFEDELKEHKCDQNEKDFSAEESSAAEGEDSDDESGDTEVDSDVSREEEQAQKKKRFREPTSVGSKLSKIYFDVEDPDAFVEQSDVDFCKAFYTDDTLFTKWLSCEPEVVSEKDLPKYLPRMEESCKIKAGFEWTKIKRFGAKSGDGTSIFVGGSIVCICWVPLRVEDIMGDSHNFLAVACHNDVDCPRYQWDETTQHENLIQIWNFGMCKNLPRIVYGIAHDFGTVWAMDWCPSGARSALSEDSAAGQFCRLGLLAVACSNGSAYIFSVPYPSTVVKKNQFVHKLTPVAELRMKMLEERSHRKVYQATSITWSKQKGHEDILVGYADGSTGYFDLNSTSPLARAMEDNIEIFFPYRQERPQNTCITATDLYPRLGGGLTTCAASSTGAPPTLRTMRPHPAYPEFKKQIFGMLEMVPLSKKKTKLVNDELGIKLEPLTYSEAICKYGIQFKSVSKSNKALQQECISKPKVHFPERFPLADVESMAFCLTQRHHDRLAVATHSGVVFFTTVNS